MPSGQLLRGPVSLCVASSALTIKCQAIPRPLEAEPWAGCVRDNLVVLLSMNRWQYLEGYSLAYFDA